MAVGINELRRFVEGLVSHVFERFESRMRTLGLTQIIDVAMLDDDDLNGAFSEDAECLQISKMLRDKAKGYQHGWTVLMSVQHAQPAPVPVSAARSDAPVDPPPVPQRARRTSAKSLNTSVNAHTLSVAFGFVRKLHLKAKAKSVAATKELRMNSALEKVHAVFSTYASESPRFVGLRNPAKGVLEMQMEAYRMGSRSHVVVAQRAREATSFFLDMAALGLNPANVTPFQVATWVRGRILDGQKTAAKRAGSTLHLVNFATD